MNNKDILLHLLTKTRQGDLEFVKNYLDNNETFNVNQWLFGSTLLHSAIRSNSIDTIEYLLEQGADPTVGMGVIGWHTYIDSPMNLAKELQEENVISLLENYEHNLINQCTLHCIFHQEFLCNGEADFI